MRAKSHRFRTDQPSQVPILLDNAQLIKTITEYLHLPNDIDVLECSHTCFDVKLAGVRNPTHSGGFDGDGFPPGEVPEALTKVETSPNLENNAFKYKFYSFGGPCFSWAKRFQPSGFWHALIIDANYSCATTLTTSECWSLA